MVCPPWLKKCVCGGGGDMSPPSPTKLRPWSWSCIRDISKYSYQSILSCHVFSVPMQLKLFLYIWSYRLGWVNNRMWRRWAGWPTRVSHPPRITSWEQQKLAEMPIILHFCTTVRCLSNGGNWRCIIKACSRALSCLACLKCDVDQIR